MKATYTCEICGNTSDDVTVVSVCELRGTAHKFELGLRARVRYGIPGIMVEGIIHEIEFAKMTHQPFYSVLIDYQTQQKIGLPQFSPKDRDPVLIGSFAEEEITPI